MGIVVDDVSPALPVVIKFGIVPIAIAILAFGLQIIPPGMNIAAGLQIGANRSACHSLRSITVHGATQNAVIIGDFPGATLEPGELSVSPVAAGVLTVCCESVAIY